MTYQKATAIHAKFFKVFGSAMYVSSLNRTASANKVFECDTTDCKAIKDSVIHWLKYYNIPFVEGKVNKYKVQAILFITNNRK